MEFLDNWFNRRALIRYGVICEAPPRIIGRILVKADEPGHIRIGKDVVIRSSPDANPVGGIRTTMVAILNGTIEISDHARMSNTGIFARERIKIGEDVFIGADCNIFDNNFHSIYHKDRKSKNTRVRCAPVVIGDRVFIGAHCIILKGVTIGADSVIAAGSVVIKDVGEKEIWGGNPAKFVCKVPEYRE